MTADEILARLTDGTVLEGPHWTEPVKVLTAKARGSRIEVQAVGQRLFAIHGRMKDKGLGIRD